VVVEEGCWGLHFGQEADNEGSTESEEEEDGGEFAPPPNEAERKHAELEKMVERTLSLQQEMAERAARIPASPTTKIRQQALRDHGAGAWEGPIEVLDGVYAGENEGAEDPVFLELVASSYSRFDLDGSGTLNSTEELLQLTTSLVWQLDLRVPPVDLSQEVMRVEASVNAVWDQNDFESWFRERIYTLGKAKRHARVARNEAAAGATSPSKPSREQVWRELGRRFQRYDLDGSGTINDQEEFSQLITNLAHGFNLNFNGGRRMRVEHHGATLSQHTAMNQEAVLEWFMANMLEDEG